MFSVGFTIPQLSELFVENFEISFDIYRNARASVLVKSDNCDNTEIVEILKAYDSIVLLLSDITPIYLTPGYAMEVDDEKLEIYLYGIVANLYKKHGYYTENGSGTIDYSTPIEDNPDATGVPAIWLTNEVIKGTNFRLLYAPSVDEYGKFRPDNRIYVRGEWLNRSEWLYEIAKKTYFYEYVGDPIVVNGIIYMPDFTTDNTNNGKLIDCCNVICDENNNIVIGIAGCQYLGNNLWKKRTSDITEYVLNKNDTVYNFIEYDNAVVQGVMPEDGETKRTYLAKPLTLSMHEVFNSNYNKTLYEFDGNSSISDNWKINTDGIQDYIECTSYRSGDCNFVVYDFATLKNLITSTKEPSTFQIDIYDDSGGVPPWPAEIADAGILYFQTHRAGLFFNLQYPYYEDKNSLERKKQFMDGYFVGLELITDPVSRTPEGENNTYYGMNHSLYLCVWGCMNMFDETETDYNHYGYTLTTETERRVARKLVATGADAAMSIQRTVKVSVTPIKINGIIQRLDFIVSTWPVEHPDLTVSESFSISMSNWKAPKYLTGKAGLFTWVRAPNDVAVGDEMDGSPYDFKVRFDNFVMSCQSETLYGRVDKPIIMERDRTINNTIQGELAAKALFETRNRDRDIKIKVDPILFFEKGLELGQWVTISHPYSIKGEHRVCGINITPDEVELCLNHSDITNLDDFEGIRKYIDILDSF